MVRHETIHDARHAQIRDTKKPATQEEMAGQVPSSRLLFPEEEIRERFRVGCPHSGHIVPARFRVKAVIGSE